MNRIPAKTTTGQNIHECADAREWAIYFGKHENQPPLEVMIGWFANAMMAMHDNDRRVHRAEDIVVINKLRQDNVELKKIIGHTKADLMIGMIYLRELNTEQQYNDVLDNLAKAIEILEGKHPLQVDFNV